MDDNIALTCPYCYQITYVGVDTQDQTNLTFIEDCQNCCHPLRIRVQCVQGRVVHASATKDE